jgi:Phasin protein
MARSKEEGSQTGNSFSMGIAPAMVNPMITTVAEMSGTILEGVAAAQKEWADFVQRRVREDVAVSRQLINCQSLADMHQICAQYLRTAFEQYRERSEQVIQRGTSLAQHFAETTEASAKEVARARH